MRYWVLQVSNYLSLQIWPCGSITIQTGGEAQRHRAQTWRNQTEEGYAATDGERGPAHRPRTTCSIVLYHFLVFDSFSTLLPPWYTGRYQNGFLHLFSHRWSANAISQLPYQSCHLMWTQVERAFINPNLVHRHSYRTAIGVQCDRET